MRRTLGNGSAHFEGYCSLSESTFLTNRNFLPVSGIDMLNEIARRLQFNYSIRIATDAAYGKEDENGQWSGIIGELTRRVNDRCVDD